MTAPLTPEELTYIRRVARNSEGGLDLSVGGALAAAVVVTIDGLTRERDALKGEVRGRDRRLSLIQDNCTLHDSPVWQRENLMELVREIRALAAKGGK